MHLLDLTQRITDKQDAIFNDARAAVHLNSAKFRKERLAHASGKQLATLEFVWQLLQKKFNSNVAFNARLP